MTDWLLHTLVATSGLILFVLVIREPVRKRFGSGVAYGLWLIPAARLFMPTVTRTVEHVVPAPMPFGLEASQSLAMAHVGAAPTLIGELGGWPTILLVAWLGVAAGLFLSRFIAFERDRRAILKSSRRVIRLGSVRLVRSPEILSPVALGILRPIIALPHDFECIYKKRERRLVLEHELAHHRSGDLVVNLFAFVLLCLQWFNPLAWVAHAAFRFDQEAACDARVLDKAPAADRASYGRAIAKAASGRALLFASALDRPTSLQRRLQSMLRSPSSSRRIAGRLLVIAATAAALPLTASYAVEYVITPAAAARAVPAAPAERTVPAAAAIGVIQAAPPAQPRAVAPASSRHDVTSDRERFDGDLTINEDMVTIDGRTKRWEDLTPAEKARVEAAVAKARTALSRAHFDQSKAMRDLASVPDQARIARIQRELADKSAKIAETIQRMDAQAAEARASGREPDRLEAAVREHLQSLQSVDFEAVSRSLASIDREKIASEIAGAQESMQRAKEELNRVQAKIDAAQRH